MKHIIAVHVFESGELIPRFTCFLGTDKFCQAPSGSKKRQRVADKEEVAPGQKDGTKTSAAKRTKTSEKASESPEVRQTACSTRHSANNRRVTQPIPTPEFKGNFDLYSMRLPFLQKVFVPAGTSAPQYEALFNLILTYQAKPDLTARCFLPKHSWLPGKFHWSSVEEPMSGEAFEIAIKDIVVGDKQNFSAAKLASILLPRRLGRVP